MKEIEVIKGKGWLKGSKILSGWRIEEHPAKQDVFPVREINHYFNLSEKGGWKNKKEVVVGCSDSGVLTVLTNLSPSEIKVGKNGVTQVSQQGEATRIEVTGAKIEVDLKPKSNKLGVLKVVYLK